MSEKMLLTEGVLLITAGSDTTSTGIILMPNCFPVLIADSIYPGLAGALFYLLKYPYALKRLQAEIDETFSSVEDIRMNKMSNCKYLKACVDESLRLAPPGPGMPPRTILPGGMIIDGEYYPEGVSLTDTTLLIVSY